MLSSCQKPKKEAEERAINFGQKLVEQIRTVNNTGIVFFYELSDSIVKFDKKRITSLKYTVKNTKDTEVEYVSNSGSGLDRFLFPFPENNSIEPFFLCNASWPVIRKIAAGDSVESYTQISKPIGSAALEEIKLDFRMVETYFDFGQTNEKPKSLESIYRAKTDSLNLISSKTIFP